MLFKIILLVIISIHFSRGQKPTFQYSDGKYWGQYYVDEFGDKIPHGRGTLKYFKNIAFFQTLKKNTF